MSKHRPRGSASSSGSSSIARDDRDDPFIATEQIADYLGCNVKTVREMCQAGTLRHVRIGGRGQIRSKRSWIDATSKAPQPETVSVTPGRDIESAEIRTALRALAHALRDATAAIERALR